MIRIIIFALALMVVTTTLFSMISSYQWWIRIWDFPRVAVLTVAAIVLIAAILSLSETPRMLVVFAMLCVIGWQMWRIFPYTMFARTEVAQAIPDGEHCIKIFAYNVLQTNRDYARTIDLIKREDPDIILLLETDDKWVKALEQIAGGYTHQNAAPLDNLYGITMFTRLKQSKVDIRYLVDEDTPSVFAWLETPGGLPFHYIGLHPRPPRPGEDTEQRDAEIAIAARMAAKENLPVLAMGDFNDVAWSRTSQIFKRIGGYVDPRVGRGLFATFPAKLPLFRWPLDHVFFTPEFTVARMNVLEDAGSDHLPVSAQLCLAPSVAPAINQEPEKADAEDQKEASQMIRDGLSNAKVQVAPQ